MLYFTLKFAHLIGLSLIAAGLFAALLQDILYRRSVIQFHRIMSLELMLDWYRYFALPGAILVLISGGGLVAVYYGPTDLLNTPWLAGMVALFTIGFLNGMTMSRRHLRTLFALTGAESSVSGLETLRDRGLPVFVRGLEVPFLILIVALGVFRPESWALVLSGIGLALQGTFVLALFLPWIAERTAAGLE